MPRPSSAFWGLEAQKNVAFAAAYDVLLEFTNIKSFICHFTRKVAGIASGQATKLKTAGVTNTFQLFAKFLSFTPDGEVRRACDSEAVA